VVRPTIIEPWEALIESAKTISELDALLAEIQQYRVLDPACGSGNFLYIAYNCLKDIESEILRRIQERRKSDYLKAQGALGYVNTNQFFGMDTDPFAVELARVTLMIARKVAHDRLGLTEQELPLDNLDKNIIQGDALFMPWPKANSIIGNPPFLGGKRVRKELGDEYIDRVSLAYPDVRDSVDFCSYWFRLADQHIENGGRAGLVATNSIREGWSRTAALDYIIDRGAVINNAISTQKWSGDAKVHVSIVNWSRVNNKVNWLDGQPVSIINSSLTSTVKVTDAPGLKANKTWGFQGATPVGVQHFLVSPEIAKTWISIDPANKNVLAPFLTADDLTGSPNIEPRRWVIDFNEMGIEDASRYSIPFEHLRASSKIERAENRDERSQHTWWRLHRTRGSMRRAIQRESGYFSFPRHSTWFIPLKGNLEWLPGDSTTVVAGSDFYVFGILTSSTHRKWVIAQKSTLKADIRYTHTRCLETFPFPQLVSANLAEKIRQTMRDLNDYRNALMLERNWGITELYNRYFEEPASKLRKFHDALDALVLKAYGWNKDDDLLANLLDLNQELAELEAAGQAVVGPWDPSLPPETRA
jgi:SAM-dependent methyltransferase